MKRALKLRLCVACTLGMGMMLVGCGTGPREIRLPESGATLEGSVKYKGEIVSYAEIRVASETGSAIGSISEGKYKVENVPMGDVKISVNTDAAKGDFQSAMMSRNYKGPDGKSKPDAGSPVPKFIAIPAKFADPETSGIKTTVKAGTNPFDISIK